MSSLDDPDLLKLDASGMFEHIREVGTELIWAWAATEHLAPPKGLGAITSMVIAGMGGSATAGDYFAALCARSARVPVHVVRGYGLPAYVGETTLVVVSSYSGNTEEAVACYDDARVRGASLFVVTTGGTLAARAAADGVPVHAIRYVSSPRAAIAHSLAPLLRIGAILGLTDVDSAAVTKAGERHRDFVERGLLPAVPESRNGAKQLARALCGRTALVLGAEHLGPAGSRFKNQLAENGKALGAAETLPEANHNLIVGLGTGHVAARSMTLVSLESRIYDARTRRRCDATAGQFAASGIPVSRIELGGETVLDELLQATAWGDYTSCYLGLLNGQDPTPIPQIEALKAALGV